MTHTQSNVGFIVSAHSEFSAPRIPQHRHLQGSFSDDGGLCAPKPPVQGPLFPKTHQSRGVGRISELGVRAVDVHADFVDRPLVAPAFLERYYKAFEAAFPDTKERGSFDDLCHDLIHPTKPLRVYAFQLADEIIAGAHLRLLDTGHEKFGVIEHIWVSSSMQKGGLGSAVFRTSLSMLRATGADFCLAEINDPDLMTGDEKARDEQCGITAEKRLHWWRAQGFLGPDTPYVQPALGPDGSAQHLRLAVRVLKYGSSILVGRDPDGQLHLEMRSSVLDRSLQSYFDTFTLSHTNDAQVEKMFLSLRARPSVPLRDLASQRTYRQERTDLYAHDARIYNE